MKKVISEVIFDPSNLPTRKAFMVWYRIKLKTAPITDIPVFNKKTISLPKV